MTTPKSFVIVGAGASGIAAHEELLAQGILPENITHIESQDHVGGKCETYHHPDNPKLMTEMGATWIVANYYEVIKKIYQHKIVTESVLPTHKTGIPMVDENAKKTTLEKLAMIPDVALHMYRYAKQAERYHALRYNPTQEFLADFYDLSFSQFAEKYNMTQMIDLLKPIVSGFNYRSMEMIPAHSVFAYTGQTISLEIIANYMNLGHPFRGIQEGYQHLLEKISEDHNIITSAKITHIDRNPQHVKVTYTKNGIEHAVTADALIIATSPLHWPQLGMKLTEVEQDCFNHLSWSRYPVAAVLFKGIPAKLYFFNEALQHPNFVENHGDIALLATRDNRENPEEGRLFTVFQNLRPRNKNSPQIDEEKEHELFMKKLHELAEKNHWTYEVCYYKVWDYMPLLPAKQSYALEKAQMNPETRTLHCTSVLPGGFETVGKSFEISTQNIRKHVFNVPYDQPANVSLGLEFRLFNRPAAPLSQTVNRQTTATPTTKRLSRL